MKLGKYIVGAIILVALCFGACLAQGAPPRQDREHRDRPEMGGGPGFLNPKLQLELGLSIDQQAKLKAFLEKIQPTKEKREECKKLQNDLRDALLQNSKDKIEKAKAALLDLARQRVEQETQTITFFISLLDETQRKKFVEITDRTDSDDDASDQAKDHGPQGSDNSHGQGPGASPGRMGDGPRH